MQLPEIIEQSGQRVLTTAQLAEAYGTDRKEISKNFSNNKSRYEEGRHYFALTGAEKRDFCNRLKICDGAKATVLYLWTECGALLHAKSLNTDKAWEVYEFLVESYFRAKEEPAQPEISSLSPMLQYLIQMEQKQNQLEQRQTDLESRVNAKLEEDREELIKNVLSFERLGSIQRAQIVKAVKKRAIEICNYAETYDKIGKRVISNIYTALQKQFDVPSYLDLRQNEYTEAMFFIECWTPGQALDLAIYKTHPKPDLTVLNTFFDAISGKGEN